MGPKNNLHTVTVSLASTHLGLAVETFHRLSGMDKRSMNAISVILHSYFGLESAINSIGYEMFKNKESQYYIPENDRNFLLKKFIKSWNYNMQLIDKIEFIELHNNGKISNKLKNELTELNKLRNWLAHGFSYSTTFLLEETDAENAYKIVDYEDSENWRKSFPNCKFNSLTNLNVKDAEKVLRIVFGILIELSKMNMYYVFSLDYYCDKPTYKIIYKETVVDELLRNPD
ncbi:MAG: hypothetical protein EOO61_05555 [Hymenobacter sp.]|nr:MAG: hypothetical protein EOO61_05555 [Hymenobacter sp.]